MVVVLFPSHTIKSGAKADLGRLFKRTKNGSKTLAAEGLAQRRRAQTRPAAVQTAKLISVSMRVTPVWATAVSVGTANFANPYAAKEVAEGIENYMRRYQVEDIRDLIGAVR